MIAGLAAARRLHRAVREGDTESLEGWLTGAADPDLVVPEGVAALHLASGKDTEGGIRCLKLLLQHGANPNVRSSEDLTPLHVAASWGCVTSVKLLLRNGADPTLLDQDGLRAVDLAKEQGNVKCCQILQEYHRYSLLEDTEGQPLSYQYVCYRRVSSNLRLFADPAERSIGESCQASRLPARSEEFHPVSRDRQSSAHRPWELGTGGIGQRPSGYSTGIKARGSPLGEAVSAWSRLPRPPSRSGTRQPMGTAGHHGGIAEDWGEDQVVGETTELILDSCVLSSTHVSTFGACEERTSNGLNSATDSSGDPTPAHEVLTLQEDESFLPVLTALLPPAAEHTLNASTDDKSFLPPSASRLRPAGNYGLSTLANRLPETQHFPVEHVRAQQATIGSDQEMEVFQDGDTSVGTEWLSELDCTTGLKGRSPSRVSLSNTLLDLAKYKGFCDAELLIRPSGNKGIDITSPDHVYVFERANSTTLPELDKTTAVLFEDSLDLAVQAGDGGLPPNVGVAQWEGGDAKASASASGSSSSPYCSCESGSEIFSSAIENFKYTSHTREDPTSQTDEDSCSAERVPSGTKQDRSVSGCQSEIAVATIQPGHAGDLPTRNAANASQEILASAQTHLVEQTPGDSPLWRGGTQPECRCPSPRRQPTYRDAGLCYSAPANPSNSVPPSSRAGPTCAGGGPCTGRLAPVPCSVIPPAKKGQVTLDGDDESSPEMLPALDTNGRNHQGTREAEPVSATGPTEDGDFPGLPMPSGKRSSSSAVHVVEASLGASHGDTASVHNPAGNKIPAGLGEEHSSDEEEGGSDLAKLLKNLRLLATTGPSLQLIENGLSPFVTPRSRSRLVSASSRSHDSLLFEQSVATPTRTRRVRNPRTEDASGPPGWIGSRSDGTALSQGTGAEDLSLSLAHSSDDEDTDFDTVPFVGCNDHKKWTAPPLPAACRDQEDADFDTVLLFNANPEKRTRRPSPQTCDANGDGQSVRLKSVTASSRGNQTVPFPAPVSPEESGDANQGDCICPPIRQSVTEPDAPASGVDQRRCCNPSEEEDSTWLSEDNDLRGELEVSPKEQGPFGAARWRGVCSRPSSPCLGSVPVSGQPEAQSKEGPRNGNVCESTRLENTSWQLGNPSPVQSRDPQCSRSRHSVERRFSEIPNCSTEWQSLVGERDLPLSPGGRPVNHGVSETLEYLYTDTQGGHTLIERRYPCQDASFENSSTSGSEETVIYDWKAYKSRPVGAGEKENLRPSEGSPRLSPRLLLLSNGQILRQLRDHGEDPGPVTDRTRKLYLHCLHRIRKEPRPRKPLQSASYSAELCQSLAKFVFPDCSQDEKALVQQFDQPDKSRKWREGHLKSSFNYLLLDPRVTKNLPVRCHTLSPVEGFRTFVSSIFYVGKGKRSRPYCHLYEALTHFTTDREQVGAKLKHILDIWASGQGVISLHCFQNVIPVEAYTREACMVDALGLQMLTNKKRGDYYGVAATWPMKRQRRLGIHMLHRALQIFLAEGERQLRPADIRTGR
uniref:uncharacterized protein n=1 Tax=Pristiophorus japonicus TaxID=55135 RepID=UPI00398E7CF2